MDSDSGTTGRSIIVGKASCPSMLDAVGLTG
jgi:hypothetical protein